MLSGHEIERLCRMAKIEPGKRFGDGLGYDLPVKALTALLDRVPLDGAVAAE